MQFKQDASVFTTTDQAVGRIDRVVLDPITKAITHVVVRKGFLFTQDKVVPIGLVAEATEERVTLRDDIGDLQALPDFEETHFVVANEHDLPHLSGNETQVPSLYPYPPAFGPSFPSQPVYITRVEENIPEGTVALKEGAKVLAADGKQVGHVEQVLTNASAGRATHFVISKGLFLKERKLVPTAWANIIGEDEVHLTVGSPFLNELRPYLG